MHNKFDVEEVLKICSAATPGPWYSRATTLGPDEDDEYRIDSDHYHVAREVLEKDDAQFIATARTLLPQLAADYRKAMEERRWIPVEERLPEELQVVLVSGTSENDLRKGYECGWLINGDWTCWFTKDITHWMPLPIPPGLEG